MNKKIYIEAGANDGIFQSRSIHLSNNRNYHGILIEPIPSMYSACLRNRPNNTSIYNCALVDFDFKQEEISIFNHNNYTAMSSIISHPTEHYNGCTKIKARTLDSILEANKINQIDFFYLDVEGYEYNVLKGINFNKRQFNMIEIECHYNFLQITEEQEQNLHERLLNEYGYKLVNKNTQEGNTKLIFYYG